MHDYPNEYTIKTSSQYHLLIWCAYALFSLAMSFLLLREAIDTLPFWAGVVMGLLFLLFISLIMRRWKEKDEFKLSHQGIKILVTGQHYPWSELKDILIMSNNIILYMGKKRINISCYLTKNKSSELIALIKHYSSQGDA